ncbi:hypothetical protein Cylst_5084 [Cylindrospermum stagnale PCC 7417]|uniref:Uncharacterized protein n=1 Tax=Cylindrospermum stagnale PCC 7417 TaxID=56107 RepID=K9X4V6_9NOST|nr:hypothetical protein [Cylindrospermum stagnale]AFZ27129.1 hypothetical protein Cylst_5084 [Cylindrospermum stagnale PCC 7417]
MKDSELTSQSFELSADLGEVALDLLFKEGLLKDIPILGSFVKLATITKDIPNQIFLSKIQRFLRGIENLSEKEKENFLRNLDSKPEIKSKVGECLVLIINRLDDMEKTDILAQLFLKYVKSNIDLETFRRLASAIDIAFIEDIKGLIINPRDNQCLTNLVRSGLSAVSSSGVPAMSGFGDNVIYIGVRISELGNLFVELMNE